MARRICKLPRIYHYPITLQEDGRISVDDNTLKFHLNAALGVEEKLPYLLDTIQEIIAYQTEHPDERVTNAIDIKQTDALDIILQCIAPEQRLTFLNTAGDQTAQWTLLHWATKLCNASAKIILQSVEKEEDRFQLLSKCDCRKITPLHLACTRKEEEPIGVLLSGLSKEKRTQLLIKCDSNGFTPLHWVCANGNQKAFELLLSELSPIESTMVLLTRDNLLKRTPIHTAAKYGQSKLMPMVINMLTPAQWCNVVCSGDKHMRTPLHLAALRGNSTFVEKLLEPLGEDLSNVLFKSDEDGCTALHLAFFEGHSNVAQMIHKCTTDQIWNQSLELPGKNACTPIHLAAEKGFTNILSIIKNLIPSDQRFELLKKRDGDDFTPIHSAAYTRRLDVLNTLRAFVYPDQWNVLLSEASPAKFDQEEEAIQLLKDSRIEVASVQVSSPEDLSDSESILAHGAFPQLSSPDESQDYVSNDSPQYDIRYGHGLAIISFCTVNRPGAKAEADDMDGALSTIGCKVHKHEWKNATEVTDLLEGILNSLTHGYDMLFVCMMSHGHSGMLNGKDESAISINDILFRLTHSMKANQWLQECMPMVMLIQACQRYSTDGVLPPPEYCLLEERDPAVTNAYSDSSSNTQIVLKRPHSVLLLATVSGGEAFRGAFTGAIAEELRLADGVKDIYKMFNDGTHKMNLGLLQTPEFRCTTNKSLVVPEAHQNNSHVSKALVVEGTS